MGSVKKKTVLTGKIVRLYPNREQTARMMQFFGCARWLWNQMLDMQQQRYANGGKHVSRNGMNYALTQLKNEYPWLRDAESTSLINVNAQLHEAFRRYYSGISRKPKFKAKKYEQSATVNCVNSNIQIVADHHIRIPKLGYVYYRGGKNIRGKIKSVTLRLSASGKFTASVLTEHMVEDLPSTGKTCGGDLGLKELLILDDGTKIPLPRWDKKSEEQLHYWQRLASRRLLKAKEAMKADSSLHLNDFKNYQKARQMCAKIQEHIANQRHDYLHRLSTWLVRTYDVIVIEDLKVKVMLHNHRLARAISNAGWNRLIEMLRCKCEWYGKTLIQVDPAYTSQTCSACGCVNSRLGYDHYGWLKVREWKCPECGAVHDRDINAAINIREKGLAVSLS